MEWEGASLSLHLPKKGELRGLPWDPALRAERRPPRACAPDPKRPQARVGGFHGSLGVGDLSKLKEVKQGTNEKIDGFDYRKLNLLYAKKITEFKSQREKERKEAVGGRGRERQGEGGGGWNDTCSYPGRGPGAPPGMELSLAASPLAPTVRRRLRQT